MDSIVPDAIKNLLRDRYLAGVADAEAKYSFSAGSEDALTGALGSNLAMPHPLSFNGGERRYTWQITYHKVRGQGPGAPEKSLGADGIFQIEVDDGSGPQRKGLPFQAKKNWKTKDKKLIEQCHDMLRSTQDGIAIDYTAKGYSACRAIDVIMNDGRKNSAVAAGKSVPLGQLLANEFLDCSIGRHGLYFDTVAERFVVPIDFPMKVRHVIQTRIKLNGY